MHKNTLMNYSVEKIKEWESVEVARSANEAQKKNQEISDLRLDDAIIKRYSCPPPKFSVSS